MCFEFDFCNFEFVWDLSFVDWDLNNVILEKEELVNQSEFCEL